MATISCNCISSVNKFQMSLVSNPLSHIQQVSTTATAASQHNQLGTPRIRRRNNGSRRDSVVRNATPEAATDLLSTFSFPTIPGFSDSPWVGGIAGLLVAVPFIIQRLIAFTKGVDVAAQTIEKIADTVGKVAEEVDKAAEEFGEALPEGGLKKMVHFVEDLAEETAKDAQKVEDLMDKVEEIDDKLEAFLNKQSQGSEKA